MSNLPLKLKSGKTVAASGPTSLPTLPVGRAARPALFNFARYSKIDEQVDALALLAMKEKWDNRTTSATRKNPILYNYLQHTFARVQKEGKIEFSKDGTRCIFNTGLVTSNYESIYELFQRNKNPNGEHWYFVAHAKASDRDLTRFSDLPEQANYFGDPTELIYDSRLPLRKNIDHIINDNLKRFPVAVQGLDPHMVGNLLNGAIESAEKRIKQNYKTAIPQYYCEKLQLLLPLCLQAKDKADLALVVERSIDHYRASTCLTLDMAFNNARLIARPDDEWLKP
jgi:hypothetical protein